MRKMSTSSIFGDENTLIGFTSSSFRDHVFQRLCGNSSVKWPRCLVVPLLTTIRDLHPDEKELKMTVRSLCLSVRSLCLSVCPSAIRTAFCSHKAWAKECQSATRSRVCVGWNAGTKNISRGLTARVAGASAMCLSAIAAFNPWPTPEHLGEILCMSVYGFWPLP